MEDLSYYFDNYPTTSYIQHTIHFMVTATSTGNLQKEGEY